MANLPGVLAYLHHEVVCGSGCPQRKFHIERILRYRVTVQVRDSDAGTVASTRWPCHMGRDWALSSCGLFVQATRAAFDACRINQFECENVGAPWSRAEEPNGVGHQFMRFVSFDRHTVHHLCSQCLCACV